MYPSIISDQSFASSWLEKDSWRVEFENEAINDERWNCIVTSLTETKVEDEECLRIFVQSVTRGELPLVRSITVADLATRFKSKGKPEERKKNRDRKPEKKFKDPRKESSSVLQPSSRFPEVLAWISKHVQSSDEAQTMPPDVTAYAIKYMILEMKNEDCTYRRVNAALGSKVRETNLKEEIIRKFIGSPEKRVVFESDEEGIDNKWQREKFDILGGSPSRDGPFNGPEMYIVLSNFYNPLYIVELRKINVPFVAVIKIEDFKTVSEKSFSKTGLKKQEWINHFWSEFEHGVNDRSTTDSYKDVAPVKFAPVLDAGKSTEEKRATIVNDLVATLYGVYHLDRLHQNYVEEMRVHRMVEMLEPLDLSRCEVYNKLCDALVTEDANCEIFVLFSIIEQVVCGVPEIKTRNLEYRRESSVMSTVVTECKTVPSSVGHEEESLPILDYLSKPVGERKRKLSGKLSKNPIVYLYDDLISLTTRNLDQNILKTRTILERFVLNSIESKISKKFPRLTPAQETANDFHFFRLWEKSEDTEENFKVKLFFSIVMRLIERTQVFEGDCEGDMVSPAPSFRGSSNESEKSTSRSDATPPADVLPQSEIAFQEVTSLFYAEESKQRVKEKGSSTKVTLELKKAAALSGLAPTGSSSLENLELACGRCPKFEVRDDEDKKNERDNTKYLEELLESYEISSLNEPNLLVNREEFEKFVAKHVFYEVLEPIRSMQRLQQLYDNYNTTEYTYFSPTDTLFVLGHDDADFRGMYHFREKGTITSPICLRDFVTFILPEKRNWMENEDAEYIRFLKGLKKSLVEEEHRKEHEFRCKFLKKCCAMSETERQKVLEEVKAEKEQDIKERSLSDKRLTIEATLDGVPDLPVKAKQSPKDFRFDGINFGEFHTQVNVVGNEFHSDDGSMVEIRTFSWLYGPSSITLTVHRMGSKLYLHKWTEEGIKKESLHFKDASGVLVTFDVDRSFPHFSKITWPNGLIIEHLPVKDTTSFYVKQSYSEKYRIEESIATESSRCFLPNGQVLVFRLNSTIEILCANGTKHRCQVRKKTQKLSHRSPKTEDENGNEELEVSVRETVTSSGEVWVAEDCSKRMSLVKTMIVLTGVDAETNETLYRREDGTNFMLWPDGKLVTSYSDGTKITSKPKFEDEEVFVDGNTEDETYSTTVKEDLGTSSENDVPNPDERTGFQVVTCSYLMENPMYSAVSFKGSKLEMRMPQKMKVAITRAGTYKIESHHSVLRASPESVDFYNVCIRCNKKSVSTIYLNSSDQDVMCKTKDFYDKKFIVYGSGQILHKVGERDVCPECDEEGSKTSIAIGRRGAHCCDHHKSCRQRQRCLIMERDLTAMEFLNEKIFYRYIGNLSEDTYYDLCRTSGDGVRLQHAFFEPVHATGRERYVMEYEENDSYPTVSTRKQPAGSGRSIIRVATHAQNTNRTKKENSKLIIARFVTVIHPDPVTVMQVITNAIALYQKRCSEVIETYDNHAKESKQFPFAKYVAKQINRIASTLCKSLDLYPHTCTITPHADTDIHSIGHKIYLSNYFEDVSPDDLRLDILPRCKQILKPFKHEGVHEDISECETDEDS